MMNRVTQSMMNMQLQRNLNNNLNQMNDLQNQMATGKKINKPSDNPVGISYAMRYRTELTATDQYQQNVDTATSWLDYTDSMLSQAGDVVQRIRELTVQGASGNNPASALDAIKSEVLQLTSQLVNIGNSDFNGKHVFNGQVTDKEAYDGTIQTNTTTIPGSGASVTGNVNVSTANVTAANNTLSLVVEGETLSITLPPRDYSVGGGAAAFATDLQAAINNASSQGNTVNITVDASNALSIKSNTTGVNSSLSITGGTLATSFLSSAGTLSDLVSAAGTDGVTKYVVAAKNSNADEGNINYEIGTGIYMPVNVSGNAVFGTSSDKDNLFGVLENIINKLDAGDTAGVSNQLGNLDSRLTKLLETRSDIGAKQSRVQLSSDRLKDSSINLQSLQSKVEDADIAELITNLKTNENIYQASLSVGSKIITPSLVDFLK